jgi:hypothetical protein
VRWEGVNADLNQWVQLRNQHAGSNLVDVGRSAVHDHHWWVVDSEAGSECRWGGHTEGLRRRCGEAAGAGHLPRRPVHGERGNQLGIALPAAQPGWRRAGPSSTDEPELGRSPRSSPRPGKPTTWPRRAANPQQVDWNARRSPVNTDAPQPTRTPRRGYWGSKHLLHRQTTPDVCRVGSWRAGCGESRTSGSEGGPEKPTDCKVDRALWPDPYF